MRVIGLTGGIASGKTTVSSLLRAQGARVIDADAVAKELTEAGQPALRDIGERFPGVIRADGTLDRARLAERIFADPTERAALNAILHPRVKQQVVDKIRALEDAGETLVVYDVPLLFENGLQENLAGVILVSAPEETQVARLLARNGFSRAEAEARIAAQMPLYEKKKLATWVIDNSGSLAALKTQVEAVWRQIQP